MSSTNKTFLPLETAKKCISVLFLYTVARIFHVTEEITLLNRTLPCRKLLNPTLPSQESAKTESDKSHSPQPGSAEPNSGICQTVLTTLKMFYRGHLIRATLMTRLGRT